MNFGNIPDFVKYGKVGEPDIPPSERVNKAYMKAIRDKKFHYTRGTTL